MTSLQEYDLESKPSHTIKGHGLCKLATEAANHQDTNSNRLAQEIKGWEHEIEMYHNELFSSHDSSSRYANLKQYLIRGYLLEALSAKQRRDIRLKVASY